MPLSGSATPPVRLQRCNLQQCEASCCYDGVYLRAGEEEKIREVVASDADFFDSLPDQFIVDGLQDGEYAGRKTEVRQYDYQQPHFPEHFTRTRCIFCTADHKCRLQLLAVGRGLHKWAYKPASCWMFPMRIIDTQPAPPPAADEPDPNCLGDHYPGFAKHTPCGQARKEGASWDQALAEEIEYWYQNRLMLPEDDTE